jgi:hypothetical protein
METGLSVGGAGPVAKGELFARDGLSHCRMFYAADSISALKACELS